MKMIPMEEGAYIEQEVDGQCDVRTSLIFDILPISIQLLTGHCYVVLITPWAESETACGS